MKENKRIQDFQIFIKTLIEAGKRIRAHYFRIQTVGNEKFVLRERVYCYELYHTLREMLPSDFKYELDGELDKRGQEFFQEKKMKYIPDFLVHKPGSMNENLIVMEVKPINRNDFKETRIKNDIIKLIRFVHQAYYFRGILLTYSDDLAEFPQILINSINREIQNNKEQLLILFHPGPNKIIEKIEI